MGSKELKPFDFSLPAYLKDIADDSSADDLAASGAGGGFDLPRISTKGFKFTLLDTDGEKIHSSRDPLHVVILAAAPRGKACSRTYYEDEYDENDTVPPDCSSTNGVHPDPWVDDPVSESCAKCSNNAWGSGKGRGKACREHKILLVTQPNMEGGIVQLRIAPTSLKPLGKFAKKLKAHNVPTWAVITKLTLDDEEDYPVLEFEPAGFVPQDLVEQAKALVEQAEGLVDEYLSVAEEGPKEALFKEEPKKEPAPEPEPKKASKKRASSRKKEEPAEKEDDLDETEKDKLDEVLAAWGAGGE